MAQINFAKGEVQCKVVYYGPAHAGKTANLQQIHARSPSHVRGKLTSISTDGDRTLFFDYLPMNLGKVAGIRTKLNLYAVPYIDGQNALRVLVLEGVDGIVFVADARPAQVDVNREALNNLRENLAAVGRDLGEVPIVFQWNHMDAANALSSEELEQSLDASRWKSIRACAKEGEGVMATLKGVTGQVLQHIASMMKTSTNPAFEPAAKPVPMKPPSESDTIEPVLTPKWHRPLTKPPEDAPIAGTTPIAPEPEEHRPLASITSSAATIEPTLMAPAVSEPTKEPEPEPILSERGTELALEPEMELEMDSSVPAPEDLLELPGTSPSPARPQLAGSGFNAFGGEMSHEREPDVSELVTVGGDSHGNVRMVRNQAATWDPETSSRPLRNSSQPMRERRQRARTEWKVYPAPLAHVAASAVFTVVWLIATGYLVHELL